jgi:hypothetical protein
LVASATEIKKEQPMRLHEWKVTIQEMVDQCNHEENRSDKVLMEWRAKLEKEPTLLQPFQIDEIVREVRQRLSNVSP